MKDRHEVFVKTPTDPKDPARTLLEGINHLLRHAEVDSELCVFAHSTTLATNALLGQIGLELPRAAIVTTKGFRDVLEIARQNRSALYDLEIEKPRKLVRRVDRFEVAERIAFDGKELEPLNERECARAAHVISKRGIELIAISFLHSARDQSHELRAKEIIQGLVSKETVVDCSCEISPEYREYERTSTTTVNLILKPIISKYLGSLSGMFLKKGIQLAENYVMQSNGGLAPVEQAYNFPAKLVESGPAAGLKASSSLARKMRLGKYVLSLDMGGTTAKAGSIIGYEPAEVFEFEVGGRTVNGRIIKGSGYPVRFPFLDLVEVSAGGGTIAWADSVGSLHVGPKSAGADPGPACYAKGFDQPTVTDAHLVLGRLPTKLVGGGITLERERAVRAIQKLRPNLSARFSSTEDLALAILKLANLEMARAMRMVTLERGHDIRRFKLVCFGGAGPLHACELAEMLGLSSAVVPEHPGLFSAQGVSKSAIRYDFVTTLPSDDPKKLELVRAKKKLLEKATERAGLSSIRTWTLKWKVEMRYAGQSFSLFIPIKDPEKISLSKLARELSTMHEKAYGFAPNWRGTEIVTLRLEVSKPIGSTLIQSQKIYPAVELAGAKTRMRAVYLPSGERKKIPIFTWSNLAYQKKFYGPLIVEQYDSTLFVPEHWSAQRENRSSSIFLKRS